jgi:hypothetical protein
MEEEPLEKYRHDVEIIRLTIEQIKKDFGSLLPDLKAPVNADTLFEELKNQIVPVLQFLFKNNRSGLQSLLYRVDILEAEIPAISTHFLPELAEKIIRREFQKILTRKYFSS